jgi:toxin FitB
MILLDTNVVSEWMKPEPDRGVKSWFDKHAIENLYISSVSTAELLVGVGLLPHGKRKQILSGLLDNTMKMFEGRILPFDFEASIAFAGLATKARKAGKGFPMPDSYIAAIAASNGFIVATRDASAFNAAGIDVINPWEIPAS